MNIRLSENSIRIRLSVADARILQGTGELRCVLATPGSGLSLRARLRPGGAFSLEETAEGGSSWGLIVPEQEFAELCLAAKREGVKRSELERSFSSNTGERSIEVQIEIDQFDVRQELRSK